MKLARIGNNFERNWARKWTEMLILNKKSNHAYCTKKSCGWMDGRAKYVLRIAYSNQQNNWPSGRGRLAPMVKHLLPKIFASSGTCLKLTPVFFKSDLSYFAYVSGCILHKCFTQSLWNMWICTQPRVWNTVFETRQTLSERGSSLLAECSTTQHYKPNPATNRNNISYKT